MMTLATIAALLFLLFGFVVFFGAPYVPVKLKDVKKAFNDLYTIGPDDFLLDLGSGDGKVVREAARRGARAIGFELNPILVVIANLLGRAYRLRATTRFANLWQTDFPDQTTIIYVFINSRDAARLVRKIEKEAARLGRPLYVLSYAFTLDAPLARQNELHRLYKIQPLHLKKA